MPISRLPSLPVINVASSFAARTKKIENKPVVNLRVNQPMPKPHFAALIQQPSALLPANIASSSVRRLPALPDTLTSSFCLHSGRADFPSLLPTVTSSKLPGPTKGRVSTFGLGGTNGFQPFTLRPRAGQATMGKTSSDSADRRNSDRSNNNGLGILGMTEEEIDERIARAVEFEVARRLEERERHREVEERKEVEKQLLGLVQEKEGHQSTPEVILPEEITHHATSATSNTVPPGVLTPLLKLHEDLDNELKRRLAELEQKYEQDSREVHLADVLSPASKKKTGCAYVALARAHSEKGNLQVALNLYKKAESYVPDNMKLKQRVLEIEHAVKNNVEFVSASKKRNGSRSKVTKHAVSENNSNADPVCIPETSEAECDDNDGDSDENCPMSGCLNDRCREGKKRKVAKGGKGKGKGKGSRKVPRVEPLKEATNSPHKQKRIASGDGLEEDGTPPKKLKKKRVKLMNAKAVVNVGGEETASEGSERLAVDAKPIQS